MSGLSIRLILVSMAAAVLACAAPVLAADTGRSYVSGEFALTMDGVKCGFLRGLDGGAISAEAISEPASPGHFVTKHVGQPKYENVSLEVGLSMALPFYDWIRQSWSMNYQRKNCTITSLTGMKSTAATEYTQCLIAETTIPACGGNAAKDAGYLTVTLAPERSRSVAPAAAKDLGEFDSKQKAWMPSNFELKIDGLDCKRVSKIDSFTVKQTIGAKAVGELRDSVGEPGKLEFPNLRITFAASDVAGWQNWFDDFVVAGNNDDTKEKGGTLVFLGPNLQPQLAKITFHNLGIIRLEPEKVEPGSEQIRRITAELYCERMEFESLNKFGAGASSSGEPAAPTAARVASNAASTDTAGQVGNYYPLGNCDFRLDKAAFTEFPRVDIQPTEGSRCMTFDFTIRNSSQAAMDYAQAGFKPVLLLSDGTEVKWNGYLLSVGEASSTELAPGKEATLRVFFEVPKGGAAGKFKFSQGDGKVYVFDVSGTGRRAA